MQRKRFPQQSQTRLQALTIPQLPVPASGAFIEQGVEPGAVVFMHRMAKFVHNHIIVEFIGKAHQVYAERIIASRAEQLPQRVRLFAYGYTCRT